MQWLTWGGSASFMIKERARSKVITLYATRSLNS